MDHRRADTLKSEPRGLLAQAGRHQMDYREKNNDYRQSEAVTMKDRNRPSIKDITVDYANSPTNLNERSHTINYGTERAYNRHETIDRGRPDRDQRPVGRIPDPNRFDQRLGSRASSTHSRRLDEMINQAQSLAQGIPRRETWKDQTDRQLRQLNERGGRNKEFEEYKDRSF